MQAPFSCPTPGVYPGVPFTDYHRWPAASSSRLRTLLRSAAHMKADMDAPSKDTPYTILGRAVHCAILEPELFDVSYLSAGQCTAIKKDGNRCNNDGISYHIEAGWTCGVHIKGLGGMFDDSRTVITPEHMFAAKSMRDSVLAHPRALSLLTGAGDAELSLVWDDKETGVRCKARLDRFSESLNAIGDVKSTGDASASAFAKTIYSSGYAIQAALYLEACAMLGIDASAFAFIAVERERPFAVAVYQLDEDALSYASRQIRVLLRSYARCLETGQYPAYSTDVQLIGLPGWAFGQIEQTLMEAA